MKELWFTHPNDLSRLHDEILAAIPALRPVAGADGNEAVIRVEGKGDSITLTVPDGADEAAIAAVVAAHDPAPRPPAPDPDDEREAAIMAATTLSELKAALLGQIRRGRVAGRGI